METAGSYLYTRMDSAVGPFAGSVMGIGGRSRMSSQQRSPRKSVIVALVFALLAITAFGAAFYLLDGMSLVRDLLDGEPVLVDTTPTPPPQSTSTIEPAALELPEGVTEEFALRLWQEQIDSQVNIGRLAAGEITGLTITDVRVKGDVSTLDVQASLAEGPTVAGRIEMQRIGGRWYFASVAGLRAAGVGTDAESTPTPLPRLGDVDLDVLNTVLAEQVKSASVLEEYAIGTIAAVRIGSVVSGPGTATLPLAISEKGSPETTGELILISKKIDGDELWFVARFTRSSE